MEDGIGRATESRRALGDRLQHWLHVRRRLANDAQDLGRGRLLFEGLGHLRVGLRKSLGFFSCNSVNRRTFSIAMTAWSAKVWSSEISSALKPPGSRRATEIAPIDSSRRSNGTKTRLRKPRTRARTCSASGNRGSAWASVIFSGARSRIVWACGNSDWSDCGKAALRAAAPASSVRVNATSSIWLFTTRVSAPEYAASKR